MSIKNLDEEAIIDEWRLRHGQGFDNNRHNCCTLTARLLIEGYGVSTFESLDKFFRRGFRSIFGRPSEALSLIGNVAFGEIVIYNPDQLEDMAEAIRYLADGA